MRSWRVTVYRTAAVLLVCACAGRARAADKEELRARFEKRIKALQQYKDAGKVGETWLGYVEAVDEKYLKDEKLKKLIAAENRDRKALYELLAKEQSTAKTKVTAEQVGKANAKIKFKKAAGGEYFKAKDGKWRTKAQMLEEMKKKRAGKTKG